MVSRARHLSRIHSSGILRLLMTSDICGCWRRNEPRCSHENLDFVERFRPKQSIVIPLEHWFEVMNFNYPQYWVVVENSFRFCHEKFPLARPDAMHPRSTGERVRKTFPARKRGFTPNLRTLSPVLSNTGN